MVVRGAPRAELVANLSVRIAFSAMPAAADGSREASRRGEVRRRTAAASCVLLSSLWLAAPPVQGQTPASTVRVGGREATLSFGGLLQVQGEGGDPGDSRFGDAGDRVFVRRARLHATARFRADFDVRVEAELAGSLSPAAGLHARLTDGYLNWSRYPQANVKAGQLKTPFGFEQLYADSRLPLAERSLASDRLTLSRQVGVQLGGSFADRRYGYALGGFNGNGTDTSANDDNRFTAIGRLWGKPLQRKVAGQDLSWGLGVAGYRSHDASVELADLGFDATPESADEDGVFAGKRRGVEVDSQLAVGRLELWGEVLRGRFEPDDRIPVRRLDADGASLLASWVIVPERWQAVVRWETFDPRRGQPGDDTTIWTLGGNWFLQGNDLKLGADVLAIEAPGRQREYRLLTRIQAVF